MPDLPQAFHFLAVLVQPFEARFVEAALRFFREGMPDVIRITALVAGREGARQERSLAGVERVLTDGGFFSSTICEDDRRKKAQALIFRLCSLSCDGAVILTPPGKSPYGAAYLCYLAGMRVRIGHSVEFGGGVLSHWARTLPEKEPVDRHLSLLRLIDPPSSRGAATFIR